MGDNMTRYELSMPINRKIDNNMSDIIWYNRCIEIAKEYYDDVSLFQQWFMQERQVVLYILTEEGGPELFTKLLENKDLIYERLKEELKND